MHHIFIVLGRARLFSHTVSLAADVVAIASEDTQRIFMFSFSSSASLAEDSASAGAAAIVRTCHQTDLFTVTLIPSIALCYEVVKKFQIILTENAFS